jgi:hypothetical protein
MLAWGQDPNYGKVPEASAPAVRIWNAVFLQLLSHVTVQAGGKKFCSRSAA